LELQTHLDILVGLHELVSTYVGWLSAGKRGHISTHRTVFEPTILVLERSKTMHDLHRATTGIGTCHLYKINSSIWKWRHQGRPKHWCTIITLHGVVT